MILELLWCSTQVRNLPFRAFFLPISPCRSARGQYSLLLCIENLITAQAAKYQQGPTNVMGSSVRLLPICERQLTDMTCRAHERAVPRRGGPGLQLTTLLAVVSFAGCMPSDLGMHGGRSYAFGLNVLLLYNHDV